MSLKPNATLRRATVHHRTMQNISSLFNVAQMVCSYAVGTRSGMVVGYSLLRRLLSEGSASREQTNPPQQFFALSPRNHSHRNGWKDQVGRSEEEGGS